MHTRTDKPAIDLTRHHFLREIGDMVVVGTWLMNDEQEDTEPALVLLPRYRPPSSVVLCVIALSAAYRYNDPQYCIRAAKGIAKALGFEDSMQRTYRIADMVYSHLPDLVSMPVDPTHAVVVGEAEVDIGNGRRMTLSITDQEQTQQI